MPDENFQPSTLPGKEAPQPTAPPVQKTAKSSEPKIESNVGIDFEVTDDMPITVYENQARLPLAISLFDGFESLYKSNLDGSQGKIDEIDLWIKADLSRKGFKLNVSSYTKYLESVKQITNYSADRLGIESLERTYFFLKNFRGN